MMSDQPKQERQSAEGFSSNQIELLSAWFCPFAQRAWIAMEEKCSDKYKLTNAMEVADDEISYVKIPELLKTNPNGMVPVVIDRRGSESIIVYDSLICVEYIDECVGDSGKLLPGPASQRARCRMWADFCTKKIVSPFYRLLMKKGKDERLKAADEILAGLRSFGDECRGPYFLGETFSFVDIALAPWFVGGRVRVLEHYRNFSIPKTAEYAKFYQWAEAVGKRRSFSATVCDEEKLIWSYKRYAEGTAKSQVGDAVRSGTTMP
uniref:Glutathione transferase n=1 Tax=Odontella aurita TaxID=265563 RepID=A0A7S4J9A9_9STRA|mmetsp:Transcript_41922/g.127122  ORF Transcript_41922/g.127122 Transcript_41922/m.127122 type:complete len:264 (+) Transcript_41922:235-1026(+)